MKRFITVLMSAMIALSMMPALAFAAEPTYVVAIGDNKYDTLVAAINDVTDGQEITLLANASLEEYIWINKQVTINLNNHNIISENDYLFLLDKGGNLEIKGTGEVSSPYSPLVLYGSSVDDGKKCTATIGEAVTIKGQYGIINWHSSNKAHGVELNLYGKVIGTSTKEGTAGIFVTGNLTNEEGSIPILNIGENAIVSGDVGIALNGYAHVKVADGATVTGHNSAIEVRSGKLSINGGKFTATSENFKCDPNGSGTTTEGAAIAIAQHTTKKNIEVSINGGEFNGVRALNESNPQNNDPAPAVKLEINGGVFNGGISAVDALTFVKKGVFNDFSVLPYLSDNSDVTIKLDENTNLDSVITINKALTLDLGGKELEGRVVANDNLIIKNGTIKGKEVTYNNGSKEVIAVTGYKGKVTLSNVAVTGRVNSYDSSELTIDSKSTVNGTVVVWGDGAFGAEGCKTPTLNVYGTINPTTGAAISTNGTDYSQPNINIFDGATISSSDVAMYIPNAGVVNVNGGSITGDSAIGIKSGKLNISGGTIIGNGANVEPPEGWSNGINSSGAAIQIESNDAYKLNSETSGTVEVNVTGGVIKSEQGYGIYEYLAKRDSSSLATDTHLKSVSISGGEVLGKSGSVLISKEAAGKKVVSVTGGVFSSNPKDFVAEGINTYHQHEGNYFVGSMPASTSGFNAWALQNGVYEETYVAPAEPETPDAPVIDNSGSGADATTNVDASASTVVKDDKAETSINLTTGNKIVENAKENNVSEVVIKAETEKGEATGSTVALPESTVQALAAEDVQASVTIKTDNATVTLDKDAVKATAEQAGTDGEVKLVVETKEKNKNKVEIELKLVTSKGTVSDFKGGNVTVAVPVSEELAGKKIVCVYIDENGKYTKMEGELSKDRKSYIFKTGHFSTYAILEEAEADAIIAEQNKPSDIASAKVTGVVNKTYTGKSITQNPVVTVGENKIVKGADYTVSYKNNVNAGVATLTIKGVGSYTGAITKTFKINPKGTSISKVTGQKKAVKVVWKKQLTKMKSSYISGYQVQYSTSSKFTSGTSKYANAKFSKGRTTKTIKNLKSGKKYYVRVRTYKSVDGTKCYSSWSKVKSVKTK